MKTLVNFKKYALAATVVLLIASCEKSEVDAEITDTNQEEGFKSTTGESDTVIEEDNLEVVSPVLHMRFDGSLSQEKVSAIFDEKVEEYLSTYESQNKGVSTEFFYEISTYTGNQTHNNTKGNVMASVHFNTNRGGRHTSYMRLDHAWPYHDHTGGWDFYLFKSAIQRPAISWVEAKHAHLRLQGTDGWFVKHFLVEVRSGLQNIHARGGSYIKATPNSWLDNSTSTGWDYYHTGNIGFGRLNF